LIDDFGYLNARIQVRRSQLIPEGFFREALSLNFPELVKILGESIYGPDLTGDSLNDTDRAVMVHFNRTVSDLPRLVSGKARETVTLLLMGADLTNIKTILRGKVLGWSADEITGHLGGGTLPRGLYSAMVEAPDAASLAQVVSLSNSMLAAALRDASRAARELPEAELLFDRSFHMTMLRRAQELGQPFLADFVRFEVDALNIETGVKVSTTGFEGESDRFFLQGGKYVELSLFRRLANGELSALQELSDTDFRPLSEVRDISALERSLRCILLARARTSWELALPSITSSIRSGRERVSGFWPGGPITAFRPLQSNRMFSANEDRRCDRLRICRWIPPGRSGRGRCR
jgi:V/A-type H+-transporting ATPase subunit C